MDGESGDRLADELRRQWKERLDSAAEREARLRHAIAHGRKELYGEAYVAVKRELDVLDQRLAKMETRAAKHPEDREMLSDLEHTMAPTRALYETLARRILEATSLVRDERDATDSRG